MSNQIVARLWALTKAKGWRYTHDANEPGARPTKPGSKWPYKVPTGTVKVSGGSIDPAEHNPMELYDAGEHHLREFMAKLSTADKRKYLKSYNLAPMERMRGMNDAQLVSLGVEATRGKYERMHGLSTPHAERPEDPGATERGDGLPPVSPYYAHMMEQGARSARATAAASTPHDRARHHLTEAEVALREAGHHDHADAVGKVRERMNAPAKPKKPREKKAPHPLHDVFWHVHERTVFARRPRREFASTVSDHATRTRGIPPVGHRNLTLNGTLAHLTHHLGIDGAENVLREVYAQHRLHR